MARSRQVMLMVPVALAAIALLVSGCSSDKATFDGKWQHADEVIADANNGGFDCSFDKSQNLKQVLTEHPVTKKPLGGSLILCQGFEVLLQDDPVSYVANLRKDCATVTKDALKSPSMSRVIVVGDNYVISGTGPDQAFPAAASPAALAKAFNGKEQTMLDFYTALCKGIPAVDAPASPAASGAAATGPSAS
jgi:hypothetical protein